MSLAFWALGLKACASVPTLIWQLLTMEQGKQREEDHGLLPACTEGTLLTVFCLLGAGVFHTQGYKGWEYYWVVPLGTVLVFLSHSARTEWKGVKSFRRACSLPWTVRCTPESLPLLACSEIRLVVDGLKGHDSSKISGLTCRYPLFCTFGYFIMCYILEICQH